ncbi:1-deoxy-D-xylulose 5-phosphate reductoisomerase [bacterium A37T11]|nr:1-deoxy-D-xylulose 5-phosphate reductoisomerase [bacterium A37T11]
MNRKKIAILGSTGSIGTQALEVIKAHKALFQATVLTAGSNADLLIAQALEFRPGTVVIADENKYQQVANVLVPLGIKVHAGSKALIEVVGQPDVDLVLASLVGFAGLEPTLAAIEAGKDIGLANKETLVVAGELVMEAVRRHGVKLLPVDSEHSAIFQCLVGEDNNPVEKIYLTASGGPFLKKDHSFLAGVRPQDALKHPNWVMGQKITIDSASLMNKGLEVIEAKWLFGLDVAQIDVVVHPQSVVHSLVQFQDGSIKAQLGVPDMKLPIQYAFSYPNRAANHFKRFNFADYRSLSFEEPDLKTFRNLALAYEAIAKGGNLPCVLNAANEIAVAAFLNSEISFTGMSDVIAETMVKAPYLEVPTIQDFSQSDAESRQIARQLVTNQQKVYQI